MGLMLTTSSFVVADCPSWSHFKGGARVQPAPSSLAFAYAFRVFLSGRSALELISFETTSNSLGSPRHATAGTSRSRYTFQIFRALQRILASWLRINRIAPFDALPPHQSGLPHPTSSLDSFANERTDTPTSRPCFRPKRSWVPPFRGFSPPTATDPSQGRLSSLPFAAFRRLDSEEVSRARKPHLRQAPRRAPHQSDSWWMRSLESALFTQRPRSLLSWLFSLSEVWTATFPRPSPAPVKSHPISPSELLAKCCTRLLSWAFIMVPSRT